ncbi:hypothetical protein KO494_00395 [Lacinutrix sp. C3R15]|uniref:hypothetical protein n=1 Tax=Flavobacteriaceae TaxID=49546 RepID=UPI001C08D3A1|nr:MULTISPECIES: hypothetical protein [Flavobacteriaceae]MBU2937986.1 hypothetical protein [Lacinutrix sp. C3R15]MDO6621300.1 hypothetical protein [Oceanihabitans sp. 1_MG-2023]
MIQNKKIIASILFLLISFVSTAQTSDMVPPPAPPPPPGLPVDAGVYVLLVIGLVYGVAKTVRTKA